MRVRLSPPLGDRMAGITPLFDNLWNEYIIWSFLVGGFTFIWLYHHSLWYKSEEGEDWDNKDGIEVGVFPKHYDNFTLEIAWTVLPFFLIVYLALISWGPLDAIWSSAEADGGYGGECAPGELSNMTWSETEGRYVADCYHVIYIEAYQWGWNFDCLEVTVPDLCEVGTAVIDGTPAASLTLKQGEVYLAAMGSADVTHAPWFVSWGVKEDVLYSQGTMDRNGDGLSDNLVLTENGEYALSGSIGELGLMTVWLPADNVENFLLLCTEYCGDNHAYMLAQINVNA